LQLNRKDAKKHRQKSGEVRRKLLEYQNLNKIKIFGKKCENGLFAKLEQKLGKMENLKNLGHQI
jgi:hypothetical protein